MWLIKEVYEYVEYPDRPLPHPLWLAWQCQKWGALPEAGGLFDQPLSTMMEMETALAVYNALKERQRAKDREGGVVKWSRAEPDLAQYCIDLDKLCGGLDAPHFTKGGTMNKNSIRLECPYLVDDKTLVLIIPDKWTVRHYEKYAKGSREAQEAFGEDVSIGTRWLFGSLALCDEIENMPTTPIEDWPLEVFSWITGEVYHKRFSKSLNPNGIAVD